MNKAQLVIEMANAISEARDDDDYYRAAYPPGSRQASRHDRPDFGAWGKEGRQDVTGAGRTRTGWKGEKKGMGYHEPMQAPYSDEEEEFMRRLKGKGRHGYSKSELKRRRKELQAKHRR